MLPTLPNGGWSITVEFHFYLILPLMLWLLRRSRWWPLSLVAAAIALRTLLWWRHGEIQSLAYWTIVGRLDQFALGLVLFRFRSNLAQRHAVAVLTALAFAAFYWAFDQLGGFYQLPSYPSPSPLWIVLPTLEGLAFAALIAWYDGSFQPAGRISAFVGRLGAYSHSIYLLHFFVVFDAARVIDRHIMSLASFYVACVWSLIAFCAMVIPGYLSFRYIEAPFLALRKRYIGKSTGGELMHAG